MDRHDGQDIQHYDSTEAIAASQHLGRDTASSGRDANSDEQGYDTSVDDDAAGGTSLGAEPADTGTVGSDDSHRVDEAETSDIYGESDANLDFDPDTDPLGMGTDDDDDMITG